ncbi:IS91 family transposase [Pseudocolwellia sp. HL-MZ7]|uniref:IS91 family transposase n=1 Tax=Pseudocolwellia sp. HL-MZ7 TaxID=3400627 RepID=UPI003CF660FF
MPRPTLEVADVFHAHGQHWRESHAGHVSLAQLKVMSGIEHCRSEVLGGHVLHCPACEHTQIAYNSCRNRHCPKCQASAAKRWLAARQTELLPVDYYHVVFTLTQPISELAYYNKSVMYGLLLKAAAKTLLMIGADTKHLGTRLGVTFVLHTWGSAMTHHPHVHGIVPGGGLSLDGEKWVSCKAGFFLPVRVLSRLFRRLYPEGLHEAYEQNKLLFFGDCLPIKEEIPFLAWLNNQRKVEWVVYAKRPFAGPQAVLAYLSRYTHRVAIANSRLVAMDKETVSFKWKNYRVKEQNRQRTMTLTHDEFIRHFLLHVLPSGFHRIRHYGLTANTGRKKNLDKARQLLNVKVPTVTLDKTLSGESCEPTPTFVCPCCGAAMIVTDVLLHLYLPRAPPLLLN